jgi:alginate O-acetyltransferase complex protein AlgI
MLFNSLSFLVFFPTTVIIYFLLPLKRRWLWLLLASYVFYMSWNPIYILLILGSTFVDYYCGLSIERAANDKKRRYFLYLSFLINLGVLFTFKYLDFFIQSGNALATQLGSTVHAPLFNLLLPVGISFYTFQSMSYTIDVYNKKIPAERHLGLFALYVSFFPQLVAGPIERASTLLPQFRNLYKFDYKRVTNGLKLMTWGLFKKVVIADNIATLITPIFTTPTNYNGLPLLIATILFAFQILCDFSGYSDIAIGCAEVMGIKLMKNFDRPYFARSIPEFWTRWHISLSTWFRDYLYIPLGGNRVIAWRWYYNIFIVFLVSGIWHGANWTFVIWGALHAFYMMSSKFFIPIRSYIYRLSNAKHHPNLLSILQQSLTFSLVCFAWIFFRANTVSDALYIAQTVPKTLAQLTYSVITLNSDAVAAIVKGQGLMALIRKLPIIVSGILIMEGVYYWGRNESVRDRLSKLSLPIRWACYYFLIISIFLFGHFGKMEFIYFQF